MMNKAKAKGAVSLSSRLYRLLLAVYPTEFRQQYGREMQQVFRDLCCAEWGRRGLSGLVQLWLRTLVDLVRTGSGEQVMNIQGTKPLTWGLFACGLILRMTGINLSENLWTMERIGQIGNLLMAIAVLWRILLHVRAVRPANQLINANQRQLVKRIYLREPGK